jgi:hypothetical protein
MVSSSRFLSQCEYLRTVLTGLGDSFNTPRNGADLVKLRNGLGKWLTRAFGGAFIDNGQTLSIGQQDDTYSCGICVLNSMEHAVCNVPLYTHADRHTLRVTYFTRLMGYLLRDVSRLLKRWQQLTPPPVAASRTV